MYEELKMILELLGDLGVYAVWVAVAYFVFKLMTLASYVLLAKYFITKVYEYFMKEKNKANIVRYKLGDYVIDSAEPELAETLLSIRKSSEYIHSSDVRWLQEAIYEKRAKEKSNQPLPVN